MMFEPTKNKPLGYAAYVPGLTRTVRQGFLADYRSLPESRKQESGEPR